APVRLPATVWPGEPSEEVTRYSATAASGAVQVTCTSLPSASAATAVGAAGCGPGSSPGSHSPKSTAVLPPACSPSSKSAVTVMVTEVSQESTSSVALVLSREAVTAGEPSEDVTRYSRTSFSGAVQVT